MAGKPIGSKRMLSKLEIRLTDNERESLDRAAQQEGMPTSRWARNALLELARKATEQAKPESK